MQEEVIRRRRKVVEVIRDWWRGYTEEDVYSLSERIHESMCLSTPPGYALPLTSGEYKALMAGRVIQFDGTVWAARRPQ